MFYRTWQFLRAAFARVHPHERHVVAQILEPEQVALFERMPRCDQRHGLDVLYALQEAGQEDSALLQAALLHDVGKAGGRLTIWHRVAVVVLNALAPDWLARLAKDGRGWKAPFAVHTQHALIGARWAQKVGCAPDTVDLIRRHHNPHPQGEGGQLAALQQADTQN